PPQRFAPAYLLFATFLAHLSAVLYHTLVIRDRLLDRMALWPVRSNGTDALDSTPPGKASPPWQVSV
ncbi:MAG TPA: hypothetical protein VGN61_01655, partial [Verrucomicrobiae bacterium]